MLVLGYATWTEWHWAQGFEWGLTAALGAFAVASIAAIGAGSVRARQLLGCGLVAIMLFFVGGHLFGWEPFAFNPWHDPRYAAFLSVLLALTLLGIHRRWFFSRGLAMALAVAGIASAGLNLYWWLAYREPHTWLLAAHIAGALLLWANLAGPTMRQAFSKDASTIWTSHDPLVRSMRWAVVTHFGAIPMLLVYAWMQPIVPSTATFAVVLAAFLSASLALVIARKAIGAIALALGGVGLLVHTTMTFTMAQSLGDSAGSIAVYYTVFWLPAALSALVCAVRLARPVTRLLLKP